MSGETAHPGSASPGGLPPMVRQRLMALATPAHYLSLAVAFGLLLYLERHTWFFNDEFAFFARMQPGHSLDLLVPYQEQWSTVPLLITLGLYKLVGLHSVLPYNVWMLLTHLAVAHLLWRWMRRIGGDPWVATALAAVFMVVGGGVEEFSIWFQVTFEMSVALGLVGALLVDHDGAGWLRDVGFWPVAVIGLMCSNVGVFMVVLGGLVSPPAPGSGGSPAGGVSPGCRVRGVAHPDRPWSALQHANPIGGPVAPPSVRVDRGDLRIGQHHRLCRNGRSSSWR